MKSWLKYTLRTAAILLTATLLTTSCLQSDFDEPLLAGDTVKVSFNVGVDNDMVTRVVGDGGSINKLLVAIYKQDGTFVSAEIDDAEVDNNKISGDLSFELLRNQKYKAVFFAYNITGYDVSDDSQTITANYGVSNPELLDAFRGVIDFTAAANRTLSANLTRAVALFVVGAKNENFESGFESGDVVTLSLPDAPTAISTLTGDTSAKSDISLTFTPDGRSKADENGDYTLLAMTYVLPGTIQPTITTVDGAKQVANAITFAANKRYNLLGNSLLVNSQWGGEIQITSLPVENVDSNGWIHIKTAEELAYLIKYGDDAKVGEDANTSSTRADEVEVKKYHICPRADLDMSIWKDKPVSAVSFTNTIIDAGKWDKDTPIENQTCTGGCYTIEGLTLANGIFGNANGVTVQNLIIKEATIGSNTAEGVGIIANTATGSLTLTNITVSGTVTGANKVGGLVGYISNSKDNEATISNCHSTATITINNESDNTNHDIFVGGLVGCFRGYTKDEVLTFEGNCSANETGYFTPFCDDEKACFNSDCTVTENLLGGEEHCRGSVYYGESRFFYRWDGVRKVTPLTENSSTSIYSPYDLADCQGKSIASMTFYNDVDMGGQGLDGKFYIPEVFASKQSSTDDRPFNPISTVKTLEGAKISTDNYTVYNLYIKRLNSGTGNAFIQAASDTTTHKNLNFNNCCTVATAQIYYENGIEDEAKAYGAIVCSEPSGAYTMQNIHAVGCKVFAAQKLGTLSSIVNGGTITNCSVTNCRVENYQCKDVNERFSSGNRSFSIPIKIPFIGTKYFDIKAELYEYYYCYGEAGGLFGFVTGNTNISNCNVTGTTVHAYGQGDKMGEVNIIESDSELVTNSTAKTGLALIGLYKIPGRHVSTFIGDIRAAGNVSITNCHVSDDCTCTQTYDNHNSTYPYIGQAYYVLYVDTEGTVTVDGKKLTLADCKTTTIR